MVEAGQPLATVNATELLNPEREDTLMLELPAAPCVSVSDAGLADIEKSGTGAGFTVSDTVVV